MLKQFVRLSRFAILAAILAVCVSPALAQQKGGRGGRGGGGFGGGMGMGRGMQQTPLSTYRNEKAREYLKLTDEQKTKLKEVTERNPGREMFQQFGALAELPEEEAAKKRQELTEKMNKTNKEDEATLKEALTADQWKRLVGIFIQVAGSGALSYEEIAKGLEIKDEQKKKLEDIQKSRGEKMMQAFQDAQASGDFASVADKRKAIDEETDKAVAEVLTKEQTEKLTAMKGEKVDVAAIQEAGRPRGGFGGGGGGGFGGGGGGRGGRPGGGRPGSDNKGKDAPPAEKKNEL